MLPPGKPRLRLGEPAVGGKDLQKCANNQNSCNDTSGFPTYCVLLNSPIAQVYITGCKRCTSGTNGKVEYVPFVVKEYHTGGSQHGMVASKQANEARLLRTVLQHPNVVKTFLPSTWKNQPQMNHRNSLFLELMDLGSIGEVTSFLHKQPTVSSEQLTSFASAVAVQVLLCLQFMHAHGCIHRDIKPDNILINREGRVKLCDFETAWFVDRCVPQQRRMGGFDDGQVDVPRTLLGTEAYKAPEIIVATGDEYSTAVDLWSLGVTLYWMVSKHLPAPGDIQGALLRKQSPITCFRLDAVADVGFRGLLSSLLEPEPRKRPSAYLALKHEVLKPYYSREVPHGTSLFQVATVLQEQHGIPTFGECDEEELRKVATLVRSDSSSSLDSSQTSPLTLSLEDTRNIRDQFKNIVLTRQKRALEHLKAFLSTFPDLEKVKKTHFDDWCQQRSATLVDIVAAAGQSVNATPSS